MEGVGKIGRDITSNTALGPASLKNGTHPLVWMDGLFRNLADKVRTLCHCPPDLHLMR